MTRQEILAFVASSLARGESYVTAAGNLFCAGVSMGDLVGVIVKGEGLTVDDLEVRNGRLS